MTWNFLYLVFLLLGLILAASTGTFRRRVLAADSRHVTMPHAAQRQPLGGQVAPAVALGLATVGLIGFVLTTVDGRMSLLTTGGLALAGGLATALVSALTGRRRCPPSDTPCRARAVRDIAPGCYGQIAFEQAGQKVIMAACSVEITLIPAGSEVEVVESRRSVVSVRLIPGE